jgi:hypothetical protein
LNVAKVREEWFPVPKKPSLLIELREPRAGTSEKAINRFEQEVGVKVFPDYRKFLQCQNGGSPVKRNFTWGKKPYQDSVLRSFFGIDCPFAFNLKCALEEYVGRIPPRTFSIADDEFDNLVLMSQQRGSTGQVLFWDHEKELSGGQPKYVAANLKAFLGMLEEDNIVEYHIATITYANGRTQRVALPSNCWSKDRNAAVEVRQLRIGEQINDFGVIRKIRKIEYSRERGIG